MRNRFKAVVLSTLLLAGYGLTACTPSGDALVEYATLNDVEFWQTYSTEKVLQDRTDIYADLKAPAVIDISAIRGEEEATQIIMTTGDKPVAAYEASVSDLTSGDNVLKKENITLYHQKYIEVGAAKEYYTVKGWYPDCLVPFENVKKVGENTIAANNNQGIYFSVEIPEEQPEGSYTGTLSVKIDGATKTIPVTVKVERGAIGKETHFLSCFQNKWKFPDGELDNSNEMLDKYNRALFDYRLGASNLLFRNEHTDKEIQLYAEYACTYAKMPECSGYAIQGAYMSMKNYEYHGRVFTGSYHNPELDIKYYLAFAYEGFKQNVNPFEKAFIYGRDEPDLNGTGDNVVQSDAFLIRHAKEDAIAILRADESIENQELLEEMAESIMGIPHVVTSSTFMSTTFDLEEEDMVYCPEFQYIETQELRDKYRMSEDNDLWWYGCCNPDYPYPTYHIDDTVISARLLSWMQADYNIQGNLYWATDYYSQGSYAYLEDYYTGSAVRSTGTNGEGYIFYPGKKYGVDGPLPSVRLEQIRDGLEEAEMILALRETYAKISAQTGVEFDEDTIMNYLYSSMYSGTRVSTTNEVFAANRKTLIGLLNLAQSSSEVCVASVKETTDGYTFEVYANEGTTLYSNGKEVTEKRAVAGGYFYTVNVSVSQGEKFNISVRENGYTYGVEMSFGSAMDVYDAEYVYDNEIVVQRNVELTQTVVSALAVNPNASADEKYLQLALAESTGKDLQDFILKDDKVIKSIDEKMDKLVIHIYNASDVTVAAQVMLEYGSELGIFSPYSKIELKPGMNVIEITNLYGFRWSKLKYINKIKVSVGKEGDGARDYLYLADMCVYMK